MARTEAEMKEILKDRIWIGKSVKVERYNRGKGLDDYNFAGSRKGKIVALYPHIFTVQFGNVLENFRYAQFFVKDGERVKL